MTFQDLGLSDKLLNALSDAGYSDPTPIQEKAIPYVLMGRDVLGCAQTGTGKTASFTLPMIDVLAEGRAKARMPRSLILAPTRELAAQVGESFEKYGKHHKLSKALLIGGSSFADQEQVLNRGVDVLIATPGRLIDLYERGKILLADVRILVIDEADRMLDMGFIPDVERIVSMLPTIRQTLFFSATMPKEIRRLADKFLMNPKEVSVSPPASPAETVQQGVVRCPGKDKRKALQTLLERESVTRGLIFCNRKRDVSALAKALGKQEYSVGELHGDMSQPMRMQTLEQFRAGEIRLLVCSDVAARGLDIPEVSHVFNYDVPTHPEDYVHRIGRTGRAGRSGLAFMLATPADGKYLADIESMMSGSIPAVDLETVNVLPPEEVEGAVAEKADSGKRRRRGSGQRKPKAEARKQASGGTETKAESQPATEEVRQDDAPQDEVKPATVADEQEKKNAKGKQVKAKDKSKSKQSPESRQASNGRQSKPFGDHTPAFLLRPVPISSATA
jgi:superfamily II DNA/RNA helicase